MSDLALIGLRHFRERLDTIDEPVQVIKTRGQVTVLGIWIPQSSEVEQEEDADSVTFRIRRKVSSKR
jgi:hypothetical protein